MVQLTLTLVQVCKTFFTIVLVQYNSTSLNELNEESYDVQNEILDRKVTVCEVECAINHLECGKASGLII